MRIPNEIEERLRPSVICVFKRSRSSKKGAWGGRKPWAPKKLMERGGKIAIFYHKVGPAKKTGGRKLYKNGGTGKGHIGKDHRGTLRQRGL